MQKRFFLCFTHLVNIKNELIYFVKINVVNKIANDKINITEYSREEVGEFFSTLVRKELPVFIVHSLENMDKFSLNRFLKQLKRESELDY